MMLKTLVKRDGRKEEFLLWKVMRIGEWAAQKLNGRVNWVDIVQSAVASIDKEEATTAELNAALIAKSLDGKSWSHYLMAGRIYAPVWAKEVFGTVEYPTLKQVHTNLQQAGLMRKLSYSDQEYEQLNQTLNHKLDYEKPHYSLDYTRSKYCLRNRKTGQEFETMQYAIMRLAMVYLEHEKENRMDLVVESYGILSSAILGQPSPFYINYGTSLHGYASCCVITADDKRKSIQAANHAVDVMTTFSAGIGLQYELRQLGDPIRNGAILHEGTFGYHRGASAISVSSKQAGRSGAVTGFINAYHPQAPVMIKQRNPMTPHKLQNRDMHMAMLYNPWFAIKVQKNEPMFLFTPKSAPKLAAAMYDPDINVFIEEYKRLEADDSFEKTYVNARDFYLNFAAAEATETGTTYEVNVHEMNRNTPFIIGEEYDQYIRQSNLCTEIALPTKPYKDTFPYLFQEEDHGQGEIALCSLGSINVSVPMTDEQYLRACYHALKSIDYAILNAEYDLTHVRYTARQRMSAGVGLMGVSTVLARAKVAPHSPEGYQMAHEIAERHLYFMIKASLMIAKERGVAPWAHKTKWKYGWLPQDDVRPAVNKIQDFVSKYDFEPLREQMREMGGLAHSTLIAYMPGESSSKPLAALNSYYEMRDLVMIKTDGGTSIRFAVPHGDDPEYEYHSAWDATVQQQIKQCAIYQKFTDQGISFDQYRRVGEGEQIPSSEMINNLLWRVQYGIKARYYYNSNTASGAELQDDTVLVGVQTTGGFSSKDGVTYDNTGREINDCCDV